MEEVPFKLEPLSKQRRCCTWYTILGQECIQAISLQLHLLLCFIYQCNGYRSWESILTINNIDENVDLVDVDEGALRFVIAFNQLNDIVVNLNRGDTYTLAVEASSGGDVPALLEYDPGHTYNSDGLIGARITSTKPVVVNSGSMTGFAFTEGGIGLKDYGFDQLVDQNKVGTKYIFKKGDGITDHRKYSSCSYYG